MSFEAGISIDENWPINGDWPVLQAPNVSIALALQFQLDDSEHWSIKKQQSHQLRQLWLVIRHALQHVPLYQEFLAPLQDITQADFTLAHFHDIPILSRQEFQEAGPDAFAKILPKSHLPKNSIKTSGSTGMPVEISSTRKTAIMNLAMNFRGHRWQGRNPHFRYANIRDNPDFKPSPELFWSWLPNSGPSRRVALNQPLDQILANLVAVDPHYLQTRPGVLLELVRISKATGMRLPNLLDITSYGEQLSPEARAEIEGAWGVPIFNNYATMEVGPIAQQCVEGGMLHINSENVICEILDDKNQPVAAGEVGRVVLTSLHNFATPFIRYEIGDYAKAGGTCACGRTLPTIEQIMGRSRSALVLPDGRRIFPIRIKNLTDRAPVKQFQVRQIALDTVRLTYLSPAPLTEEEQNFVIAHMATCFNYPLKVEFNRVEHIIHKPGDKYEDFISDLV